MTQATNLVTAPEDFNDASWIKTSMGVTSDAGVAPDGTNTAELLIPSAIAGTGHVIYDSISISSGTTYFGSVFVKPQGYDHYFVAFGGGPYAGQVGVLYDVTNKAVLDSDNGTTAILASAGVEETAGGEFLRLFMSAQAASTSGCIFQHGPVTGAITTVRAASDGYPGYTPDGVSGALSWGAQFEANALTAYEAASGKVSPFAAGEQWPVHDLAKALAGSPTNQLTGDD